MSNPTGASDPKPANVFTAWYRNLLHRIAATNTFARVAPPILPTLDRFLHRISGGRILMAQMMLPSVLLTTTGARSGQVRESPLASIPYRGNYLVIGSNWGGDKHPAWSYNLIANPEATMSLHGTTTKVRAEQLTTQEKAVAWPEITKIWPPFDRYVERSGRDLRVFRLVPVSSS